MVDTKISDKITHLQDQKEGEGPWFILICSICGLIDHSSARPELEQNGMQHKDKNVMCRQSHTVKNKENTPKKGI